MNKNEWNEFPNVKYVASVEAWRVSGCESDDPQAVFGSVDDYAMSAGYDTAQDMEETAKEFCANCNNPANYVVDETLHVCASGLVLCIECLKGEN